MSDRLNQREPQLSGQLPAVSQDAPQLSKARVREMRKEVLAHLPEVQAIARWRQTHPTERGGIPTFTAFARVYKGEDRIGRDMNLQELAGNLDLLRQQPAFFGYKGPAGDNRYTFNIAVVGSTCHAVLSPLGYDASTTQWLAQLLALKAFVAHIGYSLLIGYSGEPSNNPTFIADLLPDAVGKWEDRYNMHQFRISREELLPYRVQPLNGLTPVQMKEHTV